MQGPTPLTASAPPVRRDRPFSPACQPLAMAVRSAAPGGAVPGPARTACPDAPPRGGVSAFGPMAGRTAGPMAWTPQACRHHPAAVPCGLRARASGAWNFADPTRNPTLQTAPRFVSCPEGARYSQLHPSPLRRRLARNSFPPRVRRESYQGRRPRPAAGSRPGQPGGLTRSFQPMRVTFPSCTRVRRGGVKRPLLR